jgi:hypothetical protein
MPIASTMAKIQIAIVVARARNGGFTVARRVRNEIDMGFLRGEWKVRGAPGSKDKRQGRGQSFGSGRIPLEERPQRRRPGSQHSGSCGFVEERRTAVACPMGVEGLESDGVALAVA